MITDNPILLKIHRQFSKDESVKFLTSEIAALNFTIGVQKSEIEELKSLIPLPKVQKNRKIESEWNKDEYVIELKKQNRTINIKNKELQQSANDWREKYFNLLAQQK